MSVTRRGVLRVLGVSAVALAAGGFVVSQADQMPAVAVEGWTGPSPALKDPRLRALAFALLAPNPHNMQSWIADLREPNAITFFCDRARLLPNTDPFSRQVVIGCGCFLETLRLASAQEGYHVDAAYFPNGTWPANDVGEEPLARLTFAQDPNVAKDPLAAQILNRRSGKATYQSNTPARADHAEALKDAVAHNAVSYAWTSEPEQVAKLRAIAATAYPIECHTPRTHMETVERLRIGAAEIAAHRDGLAVHGPVIWLMGAAGLTTKEQFADPKSLAFKSAIDLYNGWIASTWSFGWIATPSNDRLAQIEAGRAYVRANLKATEIGLSIAPLSQALQEFPEMAEQFAAIRAATQTPEDHTLQMFFRMGYAAPVEPAPRRPLDAIVKT